MNFSGAGTGALRFFLAALVCITVGVLPVRAAPPPPGPVVIPFVLDPPRVAYPVIQLRINGGEPLSFVVDTGADWPLWVSTWAADRLKLPKGGHVVRATPGDLRFVRTPVERVELVGAGRSASFPLPELREAKVGEIRAFQEWVGGVRIAGVIGAGALANRTVCFDFAARTMTLITEQHPPFAIPGAASVPLREKAAGSRQFVVRVMLEGALSADLLIDTGSTLTSIPVDTAARLAAPETARGFSRFVDHTTLVTDMIRVRRFRIGPFVEPDVTVFSEPSSAVHKLGMDVLTRFRVTLDFRNHRMVLERATEQKPVAPVEGATGIYLAHRQGGCYVSHVLPGSPASGAGVRAGDRVVSFGGEPVPAGQSLPESVARLGGEAGSVLTLELERDGALVPVAIVRTDRFGVTGNPLAGVILRQENRAPLVVAHVAAGSPGARGDLRSGDVVVAIDGRPLSGLPWEEFRYLIDRPDITLEVRRNGQTHTCRLRDLRDRADIVSARSGG